MKFELNINPFALKSFSTDNDMFADLSLDSGYKTQINDISNLKQDINLICKTLLNLVK